MKRWNCLLALTLVGCLLSMAEAGKPSKPDKPGGSDGGSDGNTLAYTILELPGPVETWTDAIAVSEPDVDGTTYVAGSYTSEAYPCIWSVSVDGEVTTIDLSSVLRSVVDVNQKGMAIGWFNGEVRVRLGSGNVITLPPPADFSEYSFSPTAITEPNSFGIVEATGYAGSGISRGVLWRLTTDGDLLETIDLRAAAGGSIFNPQAINDAGVMAGKSALGPAWGYFDGDGAFQIVPLGYVGDFAPGYYTIGAIDAASNVAGEFTDPAGVKHGAVWSGDDGSGSDLALLTDMEWSEAKGIATVNGVVQVVGWGDRQGRPGYNFLWTDGVRYDLNSLSSGSGLDLARANGINSAGQIVGKGFLRRLGARGYLLMPKL